MQQPVAGCDRCWYKFLICALLGHRRGPEYVGARLRRDRKPRLLKPQKRAHLMPSLAAIPASKVTVFPRFVTCFREISPAAPQRELDTRSGALLEGTRAPERHTSSQPRGGKGLSGTSREGGGESAKERSFRAPRRRHSRRGLRPRLCTMLVCTATLGGSYGASATVLTIGVDRRIFPNSMYFVRYAIRHALSEIPPKSW